MKGALVEVNFGGTHHRQKVLGQVLDYRPDVLGGSSSSSWRDRDRRTRAEFTTIPKRGEVLVLFYEDGGVSWVDEINVTELV